MTPDDITITVREYAETMIWQAQLDGDFELSDLTTGAWEAMRNDVVDFVKLCEGIDPAIFDGLKPAMIGHNFALTRNGHGAGFWDCGLGERGDILTRWAKTYGTSDPYVGDDGYLYV